MAVSFNALVQYGSRPRIHMHSFEASSCEQFEERLRAAMSADRGYEPGMGIRVLSGEERSVRNVGHELCATAQGTVSWILKYYGGFARGLARCDGDLKGPVE